MTTKTADFEHYYRGYHGPGAICHVAVYDEIGTRAGVPLFLCTELPENTNTSITNMAEYVAAEVVLAYNPRLFEEGRAEPFCWIEHYPAERGAWGVTATYDRVTFSHYRPQVVRTYAAPGHWRVRLGEPTWRRLTEEAVCALIGQTVAGAL